MPHTRVCLLALLLLSPGPRASAEPAPGRGFALVVAPDESRCRPACLYGTWLAGSDATLLLPRTSRTCRGTTGETFTVESGADEGETSIDDFTPLSFEKPCPDAAKAYLASVGSPARKHARLKLERATDPERVLSLQQDVALEDALKQVLVEAIKRNGPKFGLPPEGVTGEARVPAPGKPGSSFILGYTREQISDTPTAAFVPEGSPTIRVFQFGVKGINNAGPLVLVKGGRAFPMDGVCTGVNEAFRIDGRTYLRIGSSDCCECDTGSETLFYQLDPGEPKLIQGR